MCSVCRKPLNARTDLDTGQTDYVHALGNECGQPFLPIPLDEETLEAVCDFCNAPIPAHGWLVRTEPFGWTLGAEVNPLEYVPLTEPNEDDGQWAACDICADLIRDGQWDELDRHSMWTFEHVHGPLSDDLRDEIFAAMHALHAPVRERLIGIERA